MVSRAGVSFGISKFLLAAKRHGHEVGFVGGGVGVVKRHLSQTNQTSF